ncbi:cytochrome P450 [Nocardia sp. NPDC052112]|uniref:cytochrome P450 n=1 Tax=Nocardia sp. NPDC052112 TaxID=3155646 RepID=UPI0034293A43
MISRPADTAPAAAGLPPGPRLPSTVQTMLVWRWRQPFLDACRRRYGNCFTLRIAPFGTIVVVSDPPAIEQVLTGDPAVFRAGEFNVIAGLGLILGRTALGLRDGDEHRRAKLLLWPSFRARSVAGHAEMVEEITAKQLRQWPIRRPFALHPHMRVIAREVILHVLFGAADPARLSELREVLPALADPNPLDFVPGVRRMGPLQRFRRDLDRADEPILTEIARRRRALTVGECTDVLSLLLHSDGGNALTDRQLRDELVDLFLGGYAPTSHALSWMFERILHEPDVLAGVRSAVHAGDDGYLEAVAHEVLRQRPPLFAAGRVLAQPIELAGYLLPAGISVAAAASLVHNSGQWHDQPREFRPERFRSGPPQRHTWIPFGGGQRRCLGEGLVFVEMIAVLRTVFTHLDLAPADREPERAVPQDISVTPSKGARAVVRHRRSAAGRL